MPSLDDAIGAAVPDPLDAAIDGVASDKSALRVSLYGAVRQNPDEAAKATQLSRRTGLPAPVIARNLQNVQQRTAMDDIDAAIDKNSALARKMESGDFAAVGHDDVESLAEIERTLNRRSAGVIGGPAFERRATVSASRGPEATFSSVTSGLFKALPQGGELTRQGVRLQFADALGFDEMATDALRKGQRAQSEVALSTPEFESATARGVYSGGSSLVRLLPGTALSVLTGNPLPALAQAGISTEAEAYGKYRARGATGGQAFVGALGEGATEVATELLPMSFLTSKLGKVGAGEFLTGLLAREIPGEQIATFVQDAIDTAVANPDKTWKQFFKERPDAAYETLIATVTQAGAMGAISEVGRRAEGAQAAQGSAASLAQVSALAAASKLRARDPQSFQEFVEAANERGAVQELYLDVRTLQQAGVDLQALARSSPTAAAQMTEAVETGGDLVIPMSEYATALAGGELDAALTPHLRTAEDALSLDEAQRFYQGQADEFKQAAAQVMEEKRADDAWQQSAKAVETQVFSQLKTANRFTDDVNTAYATLMRDFYVATASRLGITPEETFARYPLQVRAESVAGDRKMTQPGEQAPLNPIQRLLQTVTSALGITQETPASVVQAPVLEMGQFFQGENQAQNAVGIEQSGVYNQNRDDYNLDLFGVPDNSRTDSPAERSAAGRPDGGLSRDDAPGTYAARTELVEENTRELGADRVNTPEEAAQALAYLGKAAVERLDALITDENGKPLAIVGAFKGALTQAAVYPATVVAEAFRVKDAANIWFAHNHPSGTSEFSNADRNLHANLAEAFRGSDITARGLFAIAGKEGSGRKWVFEAPSEDRNSLDPDLYGATTAPVKGVSVPVVERIYTEEGRLGPQITSPATAKEMATNISGGDSGVVLLTAQNEPVAFVPIGPGGAATLRADGRMDALYRALSVANAGAAIIVNNGALDAQSVKNLAGLFNSLDARVLDVLDTSGLAVTSWAEQGKNFAGTTFAQTSRGEIAFAGDITQTPSVISLFKNADLSTFLHEMGHFQLEVLANIAGRPDAPAEIKQDFEKTLAWFGVPDAAAWNALSLEEKRPYHEQFARGFEAYLFEGKAPSAELSGVFSRFRAWLVSVYKSIKALNVEISDDIRGVFDRLVATDEAIKAAEAARAMLPLFPADPEMQTLAAEAAQAATEELQRRSLRDMRWLDNARGRLLKEMQTDAKDKRRTVEAEVRAEVRAMPIYAARRFLKTGEMVGPDGEQIKIDKGHRLDNVALAEMYPATMLARPDLAGLRGMTRDDGLHPDLVAQMFGFTSGDQLVREILAAQPEAVMIEGMTDQRMLERYGDLSHPDTLARAVDESIHNEARARFVAAELQALTKATGPVRAMTKAAKDFADTMIARKKLKDIKPRQHAVAEGRAAKAAEKALAAGDAALAVTEKRNQLVQNLATRTAYDALSEIEKAVRYFGKFDTEGTRKGLDAEYIDQIDQLLERYDFRKSVSNKDAAKRTSLLAWVEAQREQGFEPDIPTALIIEAQRKPYRELTLEELRGVVDTVKQIEHLGRLKKKLLTAKDQREFQAVVDLMVASIQDNAKQSLPEQRASDRGFLVKMGSLFRYASAIHRKFSSLARGFDGYKDGGPAWEYLVRNMNERGDFEAVETEKATIALTKLLTPVTDKTRGKLTQKEFFPSIGKSFSREERIGMLLNAGNETNLERQLTGERLSPAQLHQVLGTLTKADAEFVNQVWAYLDTFRPLIAEKERRVSGKEPDWVEAQPFTLTLANGETVAMRGGYYPIAYDPLRSERSSADINAEVARQVQQGLYARAQTRRGHTKARTESTGRPLRYDFGEVIANHVTQVIHDLAWHEYLIDANRLLRSGAIESAVREHYGVEVLKEMKDTLRDVAVGSMGAEKGATFWNHLRYGTTIAGLGFNVFNTLQNLTGVTQSMSRIGAKWVFKGAARWAGDATRMESAVSKMHEMSDFMRLRAKTMQREINDIRNKVSGKDSKLEAAYFYLQAKTQLIVDTPTWWGAYEKALAQDEMTEDKAIALADQAVIDAQGSGQTKDLAGIQRGGAGMKLFTTFYSFFNTTFNLTAEAYGRTDFKKPGEIALFAADVALLYSIPALLTTLLKATLMGDWDDEEKLVKKIIGDQISFAMGTVVGLREAAAGVQAATGTGEGFGYTGPASVRFFADIFNLGKQINQGEADEAFWKALDNTGGVLFHYPAGQINRTASGIAALMDGRTENPMAIVMGAPRKN